MARTNIFSKLQAMRSRLHPRATSWGETWRLFILAFALTAGIAPAFAQAPAPVPALPDTERRTSYSISATTCACAVNFALYGDSTDYQNWVEVWLNGVQVAYNDATFGWTITSPSGSLATLARPITDAVLTFNSVQTGTVQIVGARRPRRTAQFSENRGVAARDLNQALTDVISQNRETWDKINDVTGRGLFFPPGTAAGPLPSAAACVNGYLGFDSSGANPICRTYTISFPNQSASTFFAGPTSGPAAPPAFRPLANSDFPAGPAYTSKCNPTNASAGPVDCNKPEINIKDAPYNAVCNGTTDDSTVINNAITAMAARGGGDVIIPPSTTGCAITSSLILANGVCLKGTGQPGMNLSAIGPAVTNVYPARLLWTGTAAGVMIDSDTTTGVGGTVKSGMCIDKITLDGQVAGGSLATSALKGLRLQSSFNSRFDLTIQNIGHAVSFEPNYNLTAVNQLVDWHTFNNLRILSVGTCIDFNPNYAGSATGGVTNNFFYNFYCYNWQNTGLNYGGQSDDNRFFGGYMNTAIANSTAIIFNSLSPTTFNGVYSNDMYNFEVDLTDNTGNLKSILVNNTGAFNTVFQGFIGQEGSFLTAQPVIQNGGSLTVIDDVAMGDKWNRNNNSVTGPTINNPNAGSSAFARLTFSNNAQSSIGFVGVNSNTNASYAGGNSLDLVNTAAAPIGLLVNNGAAGATIGSTGGLQLGTPTGGDKGNGSINLSTAYGNGNIWASATNPTIASGFCTTPSVSGSGGTLGFLINVGSTCAAGAGTLTMPVASATGWTCSFADTSVPNSNVVSQTGGTTTTVTLQAYSRTTGATQNFTSTGVIRAQCTAF